MIVYNARIKGKEYHVSDSREGEHLVEKADEFYVWVNEEEIDELEIDCGDCGEESWVETGTWALDRELCYSCNCACEGG